MYAIRSYYASNLNQQLWQAIKDQYPEMFAYFLSFVVIGRYWLIHHRVFRLIHRVDPGLFSLNLALLSLIAFMPYSTEIYGRYQSTTSALVIYALTIFLVGIVQVFVFEHINSKKLLDPKVRPDFLVMARPRSYRPHHFFDFDSSCFFHRKSVDNLSYNFV